MTDNRNTYADPYMKSFTQSFAEANYKPATIKAYRQLVHRLGRLMEDAGVLPSALTPDLAEQLARSVEPGPDNKIRFFNLARRFAQHLIDIGVVEPAPLTEAQSARRELLADYETYLVKQRGLSPRTIYHTLRFADRFLDHHFGAAMIDLGSLRPADAVGFVQHLLTGKRPYRDKTAADRPFPAGARHPRPSPSSRNGNAHGGRRWFRAGSHRYRAG